MTKHLAKCFVDLRSGRLAPQRIPELRFNHVECRFLVAELMVVLHKPLLIIRKEVVHLFPKRAMPFLVQLVIRDAVSFERDVRHCLSLYNGLKVIG